MRRLLLSCLTLVAVAVGLLVSCRDQLVQTAYLSARSGTGAGAGAGGDSTDLANALDCSNEPDDSLPAGASFGEGQTVQGSDLVGFQYGAGEGPGLRVAARDTVRVYLNGALVAASNHAREPIFVPLSLLPGDNVIALAVKATTGTPAVVALLEELEQSYPSDRSWKVSTSPDEGWTALGYDDSDWPAARELADLGGLPGCDPAATFPVNAGVRWIGAGDGVNGVIALRLVVRIAAQGFGAAAHRPAVAPVLAKDWNELQALAADADPAVILLPEGVLDLRQGGSEVEETEACATICSDYPQRKTLTVAAAVGSCATPLVNVERNARRLKLSGNKTFVGLGRGAALRGVSFELGSIANVIVRNVALYDINPGLLEAGDAFTLSGASDVWLDHVTLRWISDAFVDSLAGTRGVTISYAHFDGATDGECAGKERWAATFTDGTVTIHHCRFEQLSTRAPEVEGPRSQAHIYNNAYSNTTDWTLGASCGAQLLLEGNVFEHVDTVSRIGNCSDAGGRGLVNAPSGSNLYRDGSPTFLGLKGEEPHDSVFRPGYPYVVEPAGEALSRVVLRAGAGGPWAQPLSLQ